ncbi:hypothetical protein GH714_020590 [Hevea brasiliensis]|uniref:Uncharacterized protein n=1 Tax=Hevea brasiliensis TaxID=3981 RepID=A0A6A6M321_HEVBR|nr:hypothetical protein GH714_020590 [Hevea brasiliensis]
MGTSRVASDPNPHHLNQVMELRVFAYSSYHRNITNSTSKSSSGDGEAEEFKNDKLPTKFVGDNFVKEAYDMRMDQKLVPHREVTTCPLGMLALKLCYKWSCWLSPIAYQYICPGKAGGQQLFDELQGPRRNLEAQDHVS